MKRIINTQKRKDNIEDDLPDSFYKYYALDNEKQCECRECDACKASRDSILEGRLKGNVYFSTPLNFNDLIDSQLKVQNNFQKMDPIKLKLKLKELYYRGEELSDEEIEQKENILSMNSNNEKLLKKLHQKQLENTGILCFTKSCTNANMWGYYANNNGFCVEYDTTHLIYDIILDFAVCMDEKLINLLIKKDYLLKDRDIDSLPKRTRFAQEVFNSKNEIREYLNQNSTFKKLKLSNEEVTAFVQNLYIKRLWGRNVEYKTRKKIERLYPTIIEDKLSKKVIGKYFIKEKFWEHENEYRFILSLGGSTVINLRPETIKSITFGKKTKCEVISKIKEIIPKGIKIKQIDIGEKNKLITKEI
ncbi:hypothetical protein [Lactococcus lactis]|uniref:hypothetical protein n=1 Tax=Lactococcus lactis TaxID=1358 RepID=UPI001D197179|nr:hypothetical protein [Lactococcus lactis]MCC4121073.1 hypothetical protein [Lactococcus lactis]